MGLTAHCELKGTALEARGLYLRPTRHHRGFCCIIARFIPSTPGRYAICMAYIISSLDTAVIQAGIMLVGDTLIVWITDSGPRHGDVLLSFYKTITWFRGVGWPDPDTWNVAHASKARKITRLRLLLRALFLIRATFPRVCIGNETSADKWKLKKNLS